MVAPSAAFGRFTASLAPVAVMPQSGWSCMKSPYKYTEKIKSDIHRLDSNPGPPITRSPGIPLHHQLLIQIAFLLYLNPNQYKKYY